MSPRWRNISRRQLAGLLVLLGAGTATAVVGTASCGTKRASLEAAGSASHRPERVRAHLLEGTWTWSHTGESRGVRKVETERWQLAAKGSRLRGSYDRTVTVMSLDGVPFGCNQDTTYVLRTRYQLTGTVGKNHFDLRELTYEVAPSPCETGQRTTASYRGTISKDTLVLRWPSGSQTLHRAPSETPERRAELAPRPRINGAWEWTNRSESKYRREVRVEREDWQLSEKAGTVTGTYLRSVTVFHERGSRYDCSGASYYQYKDRYTVRGLRRKNRIVLNEISVTPEHHPCIAPRTQRHLDAARGQLIGAYLILDWRGRRQVLRRPHLASARTAQR